MKEEWVTYIKHPLEIICASNYFSRGNGTNEKENGKVLSGRIYYDMPVKDEKSHHK